MRILLAAGADPRAQDPHFRTVLHTAAMINDAELVKVIFACLEFGKVALKAPKKLNCLIFTCLEFGEVALKALKKLNCLIIYLSWHESLLMLILF